MNVYYFWYPYFLSMNLTIGVVDKILPQLPTGYGTVFPLVGQPNPSACSSSSSSCIGILRTEGCGDVMKAYRLLSYSRSVTLFGSEFLLTTRFSVTLLTLSYVSTVAAGYICLLTARSGLPAC